MSEDEEEDRELERVFAGFADRVAAANAPTLAEFGEERCERWRQLARDATTAAMEGRPFEEPWPRIKEEMALVLAALQALRPAVDVDHGRPGSVPVSQDAYGEPCVLLRDIPEGAKEAFEAWIGGQSMPITRQADGLGCYVEDYERWLRGPGLAWPEARLKEEGGREREG